MTQEKLEQKNREIKFRFWDEEIDRYENQEPCMRYWPSSPNEISLGSWILGGTTCMQFTGIHDKNGKEIYEGDIVKWADETHVSGVIKKVEWLNNYTKTGWNILSPRSRGGGQAKNNLEIIGNIYENPELLNHA